MKIEARKVGDRVVEEGQTYVGSTSVLKDPVLISGPPDGGNDSMTKHFHCIEHFQFAQVAGLFRHKSD